ncbi:hypothetical protein ABZ814_16455 [Micromonospora musae]|uniref:hypothetical protein n=1 Tax=Micromonospora musae TaxID=1894970 RepID=UPI0033D8588C
MLSAFLQGLATKLVEAILGRLVEWLAPKALRSVPHRASPNCPRCGGYGVARWAPARARAVFLLSLFAFGWGSGFTLLGVPVVVLHLAVTAVSAVRDGAGHLLPALLAPLGLLVPGALLVAGAFGLSWYHSHPPRSCARCHGRWPRRERDEYLRSVRSTTYVCGCGQRLRVPRLDGPARLRCPRCGSERATPASPAR